MKPLLVVGSGPVACAFAAGWRAAGIAVDERRGRDTAPAVEPYETVVIAVADRAIADVARGLVAAGACGSSTMLHAAGALDPAEVFAGVRARVGAVGLCHPLVAVADADPARFRDVVFAVAGDARARDVSTSLARALGGRPTVLDGAGLARYHAAAVLAGNHTLALVAAGVELLVGEGVDRRDAERALAGLLASAAANVARLGLPAALTGPMARGDAAVVERHLASLPPSLRALYRATGVPTLALARAQGRAGADALDALARLLAPSEDG